jgi:hypothetical protein
MFQSFWNSEMAVGNTVTFVDYAGLFDVIAALVLLTIWWKRPKSKSGRKLELAAILLSIAAGILWVVDSKLNHRLAALQSARVRVETVNEMAKIDPLHQPIKSFSAQLTLFAEGTNLVPSPIDPVVKPVIFILRGTNDWSAIIPLNEARIFPFSADPLLKGRSGRIYELTFTWPSPDWLTALLPEDVSVDKALNVSVETFDKRVRNITVAIPGLRDGDAVRGSLIVTLNGSIRRRFLVPTKSSFILVCPLDTNSLDKLDFK